MDAWSSLRDFYTATPVYMLKDDHDLLADDVHPGSKPFGDLTIGSGLRIWRENVPLRGKPYRTLQWGKDLQIWFLEGREYRSANDMPDGEGKSIWGTEQKEWLSRTIRESKATFKIVCSPTPVVGPDRPTKKDNHANKTFAHEGDWARRFFAAEKAIIVNGDRHWQYVSRDAKTGLWEFGSGPVSDFHAQGWPPDERGPEHRFLRVAGGFLGIRLSYKDNGPILVFTHYDVDGKPTHEETITPKDL
jgi:alkaline phosphatase D